MIKKFVYIGLLLILIFFVILLISSSYFLNQLKTISQSNPNIYINKTIQINPSNYSYFTINIKNIEKFVLVAKFNNPINFYLFNNSGFNKWNNSMSNNQNKLNGFIQANSLINNGSLLILKNTSLIEFPKISSSLIFKANLTKQPLNQTYYFVIDNTNGSKSVNKTITAEITYIYIGSKLLVKVYTLMAIFGLISFIILIAGIVFIIFGALKNNKKKKIEEELPTDIKKIYSQITSKTIDSKTITIKKHKKKSKGKRKK